MAGKISHILWRFRARPIKFTKQFLTNNENFLIEY